MRSTCPKKAMSSVNHTPSKLREVEVEMEVEVSTHEPPPVSMPGTRKRNYLPLEKRIEVIKTLENNPGMNIRRLGEQFSCGKSQIACILKNKESLLSMYEASLSGSPVRCLAVRRTSEFAGVNDALYQWYTLALSKNVRPTGPQLIEKAKEIAGRLGKHNFKGSNGWLAKWKKRFDVRQRGSVGGGGGGGGEVGMVEVQGETIDTWRESLSEITKGYGDEDIWTVGETGILWRALPNRGFGAVNNEASGGGGGVGDASGRVRRGGGGVGRKERVTVAFFVSAAGTRERPVVMWSSETPHSVQGVERSALPVEYYSQDRSWMTGEIMEFILAKLNHRLIQNGRSILLLMESASCHPASLKEKFSNILVVFLPKTGFQPLDFGIVQTFKLEYRTLLLKYLLAKTANSMTTPTEAAQSMNVLAAIRWIAQAWEKVESETIARGFRKAGVLLDATFVGMGEEDETLFEQDCSKELQALIDRITPGANKEKCSVKEYVTGDSNIDVCINAYGENWQETFLEQLGENETNQQQQESSGIEATVTTDHSPPPPLPIPIMPRVQSYSEAISALEDTGQFLLSCGHTKEAMDIGITVDSVASCSLR